MKMFITASALVSWCDLKPRNEESAGKIKSHRITHGNKYIRKTMIECVWGASKTQNCFFSKFSYIQTVIRKKNAMKVKVAIARRYNKFLAINKDIEVSIDMEKVTEDSKWDGWKGYITNTDINVKDVISQYNGLLVVERSFRISKGTLEMRPIFHFTEHRIEAHVCLCFVALKVYKKLERLLRVIKFDMSVDKILDIAKTLSTITIALTNGETAIRTLFLTHDQKLIEPVFEALGV